MEVKQSETEINQVLNKCSEAQETGETIAHGQSYEDGVKAGIEWILGWIRTNPMEE
jgi:hypothetical protein